MKLYDDCIMERHYFNHFLMVTTGEVSKLIVSFSPLSVFLKVKRILKALQFSIMVYVRYPN